ncbi:UNKNOWN [Stylonychia lemnae]|uniref:Uncharacterized protein n=1 Tax=Stylonychia lemnae TaxID=5949 RepID=A0A077ZVF6_STYLE|nr:UNKNOWN [Stylonychia lemnae]|eukprot:CDW72406.1 UNKNOWN [Stylonychia lemnae]
MINSEWYQIQQDNERQKIEIIYRYYLAELYRFFNEKHIAFPLLNDHLLSFAKKEDSNDNIKFRIAYLMILKDQNMNEATTNETLKFLADYMIIKQTAWKYLIQGNLILADLYEELSVYQKAVERIDQAKQLLEQNAPDHLKNYWLTEIHLKYAVINSEFYKKGLVNDNLEQAQKLVDLTKNKSHQAQIYKIRGLTATGFYQQEQAQGFYEKMLKILKQLYVEHHPAIIRCYKKLLFCCINRKGDMERLKHAEIYCEKAFELAKEIFDIQDSDREEDLQHLMLIKILLYKAQISARMLKREEFKEKYQRMKNLLSATLLDETNINQKMLLKIIDDAGEVDYQEISKEITRLNKKIMKRYNTDDNAFYFLEYFPNLQDDFERKPYKAIHFVNRGMKKFEEQFGKDSLLFLIFELYQILIDISTAKSGLEKYLQQIENARNVLLRHFCGEDKHFIFLILYQTEITYYKKMIEISQINGQNLQQYYLGFIQRAEKLIEINHNKNGIYSSSDLQLLSEMITYLIPLTQFEKAQKYLDLYMEIVEKLPWIRNKNPQEEYFYGRVLREDLRILNGRTKDWREFDNFYDSIQKDDSICEKEKQTINEIVVVAKKLDLLLLKQDTSDAYAIAKSFLDENEKSKKYSDAQLAKILLIMGSMCATLLKFEDVIQISNRLEKAFIDDSIEFSKSITPQIRKQLSQWVEEAKQQIQINKTKNKNNYAFANQYLIGTQLWVSVNINRS